MSSEPASELIHIIFSEADVEYMAEDAGIDLDIALERARNWAKYVEETASTLINEQMFNIVADDQP